ncbi:MAG: hypothetical protein E7573_06085 [Ruminococcaceae bacterium]|nr:hypothetical protein [Oscillospiraceae bacterium]
MYDDKLKFNSDGKFKIMQIADVQEGAKVSTDTLRLMKLALGREKPDLVVFTGDQLYGVHPSFYIGDKRKNAENTIKTLIEPVEKAGIPFAVTFGNHDCQVGLTNARQAEIYNESPCCIHGEYAAEDDKGTFRIPLFNEEEHVFDVYLIDSNGQTVTGEYLPVSEKQLEWFRNEREKAKENGKYTGGIVFQHIPVPEFYDVLQQVKFGTKGAVEAFRNYKGKFFILPEEIRNTGGFMGESPAVPDRNSGEFDILKEKGNILALIVGHDHINSFVGEKDGIKLIYTQCAGFNVYGPKLKRGMRIIELDKNDLSSFRTYTVTYAELTDEKLSAPLKEFALTHIPTSMEQVKRLAILATGAGTLTLAAGTILIAKRISTHRK